MSASPEKKIATALEWYAAALISVAIVWLHFHFWASVGGLWRDEVNTVNLSHAGTFGAMTRDSFPVLMPLLLKIWAWASPADWWLRALGMLSGLAIPAAFWAVARSTRRPPLFSLVLFGLNSLLIIYGDSLRAYGLGTALIVLALAAMWWFLKNSTWSRATVFALTAAISLQALYQNAVLVFALCLGGFAVCARRKEFSAAVKIFIAGLAAALSLLPYLANLRALPQATVELRRGFSPATAWQNFSAATDSPFDHFTAIWEILALVVLTFALLSLRRPSGEAKSRTDDLPLFAGTTLLAVSVCFLAFLWCAAVAVRAWYFIPPLALIAICFDLGIGLPEQPPRARVVAMTFLLGTALLAVMQNNILLRGHFSNADQLAAGLRANARPEDFILVTPWYCGISFGRYFSGATPWNTLPPIADHSTHRYDQVLEKMADTNSLAPVLEKISATLRGGHRVWIVGVLPDEPADRPEPFVLPAPPLPEYGWSDLPYMTSWAERTQFFLNHHAARFGQLALNPGAPANFQENLQLFMAEGWRTNAP